MSTALLLAAAAWATFGESDFVDRLPRADADAFRQTVETLADPALRGRAWPDSRRAARLVATRLGALGLTPLFGGRFISPILDTEGREIGENVGAVILGSDPALRAETVFVTAHHDHLGVRGGRVYPGANDNASGVAMVLEAARILRSRPLPRTVVFVSFGLEERMLWGSRTFTIDPPVPLDRVQLFITADMIGRPLGGLPLDSVFVIGGESVGIRGRGVGAFAGRLAEDARRLGQTALPIGADIVGTRSDYGPFRDREVPFLFFSTGENADYHRPTDLPDRLDYPTAARITDLVVATAARAASAEASTEWESRRPPQMAEAEALLKIARLVMAEHEAGRFELSLVQRVLVTQVLDGAAAVVDRGVMTVTERTRLKRGAQAMLVTLF